MKLRKRGAGFLCAWFGGLSLGGAVLSVAAPAPVLVEAESFVHTGGWVIDTQFIHSMGSPYLLAHGLGRPVADAVTTVRMSGAGRVRVWVRTKDWVAPWGAPGNPGRFQVAIDGRALPVDFGVRGADWGWRDGGVVSVGEGGIELALRDLTGFDGRCDAVLLHPDLDFQPPNDGPELRRLRIQASGLPERPEDMGAFDLVVCGGGYAGMAAALSAARQALRVALIQDRMVLGGNGSSEVRVWANGGTMRGQYPHLGEIVEEFADHAQDSPGVGEEFGDAHKEQIIRAEPNIELFLGHYAYKTEVGSDDGSILAVTALDVRAGRDKRFRGRLFVDATGHGSVGVMAGARFRLENKGRMGMSNMWFWQWEDSFQSWPETPWALPLELGDFPRTVRSTAQLAGRPFMKGEWFWESGFDQDPIHGAELIRDWNLRAVYGAFTALKHGAERDAHANAALKWVAFIGGPRESRMLDGDVILTRQDIVSQRAFPDGCVATTWDIDLHYPKEQFAKKFPENPFISRAEFGAGVDRYNGYPVPYRCFYSSNVPNLFMAGRCVSVDHEALGTIRVMRTLGMMGEVVGKAAYLCVRHNTNPRGVYADHWNALDALMRQPGAMRRASLEAELKLDPGIRPVRPYFNKSADRTGQTTRTPGKDPKALPGLVLDDSEAELKGPWSHSRNLSPHVGDGYRYAAANSGAEARYGFTLGVGGRYEVRLAWTGHENRSSCTPCIVERPGRPPLALLLDQTASASAKSDGFHSLGVFEFPAGQSNTVILKADGADGFVHADALQLLVVND